ncbi:hypothetical protein OUZ56_024814 [Daphnia magna]|uniref:Uncharacterized protein n=1 Tax=Daphnia magna TaxID=35525 RepID=A0ABQ9ZI17_9CRUS|nr:hypothetical protein OUZ56_024814 [Daphnia magna]
MTKMSRILPLLLFVFLVNGQIPKRERDTSIFKMDDSSGSLYLRGVFCVRTETPAKFLELIQPFRLISHEI